MRAVFLKCYRYMFLFLFKSFVIRDMRKHGFLIRDDTTVKQLHRFWFKDYDDTREIRDE